MHRRHDARNSIRGLLLPEDRCRGMTNCYDFVTAFSSIWPPAVKKLFSPSLHRIRILPAFALPSTLERHACFGSYWTRLTSKHILPISWLTNRASWRIRPICARVSADDQGTEL